MARGAGKLASIIFKNVQELTQEQLDGILRKALNVPLDMSIHVECCEQGVRIHTAQEVLLDSKRGLEEKFGACVSSLIANSNGLGHRH